MCNHIEKIIQKYRHLYPDIQQLLLSEYFKLSYDEKLSQPRGKFDLENHAFRRYERSLRLVIPWLQNHMDLGGARVLEIGSGTGSSTAALAAFVDHIDGYDIDRSALEINDKRLQMMGLANTSLYTIQAENLVRNVKKNAHSKYDLILFFAVLEHQTTQERHETLKECWELLEEGGLCAIIETPNLLHFEDFHTSQLHFLHFLPTSLYAQYARKSPRRIFAQSFYDNENITMEELETLISRWGRGVSYHDFELALGDDFSRYIVAAGFEPEMLEWFPCTSAEEILRWYVIQTNLPIPLACTRSVLNFLLRKPVNGCDQDGSNMQQKHIPNPPPAQYITSLTELHQVQQNLDMKERQIQEMYDSTTWKIGSLFTRPVRNLIQFVKR